jgi:hypothetical protein
VLISAFDLDNEEKDPSKRTWKPKFFHNFEGADSDGEIEAYKAALYTSAAPTYFPSVDGFVDGGVVANNPSLAALVQTQDSRAPETRKPKMSQISLLSIGTGTVNYFIKGKRLDWGYAQWAKPLISLMLDGVSGVADFQCRQLLGKRYHRVSPVLENTIDLDNYRMVQELVDVGSQVDLSKTEHWLKSFWIPDLPVLVQP